MEREGLQVTPPRIICIFCYFWLKIRMLNYFVLEQVFKACNHCVRKRCECISFWKHSSKTSSIFMLRAYLEKQMLRETTKAKFNSKDWAQTLNAIGNFSRNRCTCVQIPCKFWWCCDLTVTQWSSTVEQLEQSRGGSVWATPWQISVWLELESGL